jgi:hypothetical protein
VPGDFVRQVREHLVRVEVRRVGGREQRRLDRVAEEVDREGVGRDFAAEDVRVGFPYLLIETAIADYSCAANAAA